MFFWRFVKPVRDVLRIFSSDNSSRQLALGVAMGLLIGLLPKGNLLAVALTGVLFTFRMNLGTGLLTTFVVSLFAQQLDALTHGIGLRVLRHPVGYDQVMTWYELPLVPWTSLNNTVVVGGLILGVALFYPTYVISESLFRRIDQWRARTTAQAAESNVGSSPEGSSP